MGSPITHCGQRDEIKGDPRRVVGSNQGCESRRKPGVVFQWEGGSVEPGDAFIKLSSLSRGKISAVKAA